VTVVVMEFVDCAAMAPTFGEIPAAGAGCIGNFVLRRFLVFPQAGVVRVMK
jgi:hypothetical protein